MTRAAPDVRQLANDTVRVGRKQPQQAPTAQPNGPGQQQFFPPLESATEFIKGYRPQRPLLRAWDLKRSWLYALTAPPGYGKTSIALFEAFELAQEGKRVLYLAGENPDDVRARTILMQAKLGLPALPPGLHFVGAAFDLRNGYEYIKTKVAERGGTDVLFVDTSPAYFVASGGTEENDNVQQIAWAALLRSLTELDGYPAVLALCHPIKRPSAVEDCVPRGGGGFMAQIDGNYCSWLVSDTGDDIFFEFHFTGKFRGYFEPLTYHVQRSTCPQLVDANNDPVTSVWCRRADQRQQESAAADQTEYEDVLLLAMADYPGQSLASWARLLGWQTPSGAANKQRVARLLQRLQQYKLVRKGRNDHWHLLAAGKTEAKRVAERVRNEAA